MLLVPASHQHTYQSIYVWHSFFLPTDPAAWQVYTTHSWKPPSVVLVVILLLLKRSHMNAGNSYLTAWAKVLVSLCLCGFANTQISHGFPSILTTPCKWGNLLLEHLTSSQSYNSLKKDKQGSDPGFDFDLVSSVISSKEQKSNCLWWMFPMLFYAYQKSCVDLNLHQTKHIPLLKQCQTQEQKSQGMIRKLSTGFSLCWPEPLFGNLPEWWKRQKQHGCSPGRQKASCLPLALKS